MKNIINFNYNSSKVRTKIINDEPYFCLKDICEILEIKNHKDLNRIDEKGVVLSDPLSTKGGNQKLNFINEPNLYRVIFRSNKQEAVKFQDWVFEEVLPSLRKNGIYKVNKKAEELTIPQLNLEFVSEFINLSNRVINILDDKQTTISFQDLITLSKKGMSAEAHNKLTVKSVSDTGNIYGVVKDLKGFANFSQNYIDTFSKVNNKLSITE